MMSSIIKPVKSVLKRAWGINDLHNRIDSLEKTLELYRADILTISGMQREAFPSPGVYVETEFPVAFNSNDHKYPRGTKNDNTRYPRFCYKCEQIFDKPLRYLDIGCAGGGLVLDFLLRGHLAIGIEGSDFSRKNQRAEWPLIPHHLFTCDVTKPFLIRQEADRQVIKFDVISAWEVLEHISESALSQLFSNIVNHLTENGLFVASVATFEDSDPETGAVWHVTIRPKEWWLKTANKAGLLPADGIFSAYDYPRLPGGPVTLTSASNFKFDPKRGFHLALKKAL